MSGSVNVVIDPSKPTADDRRVEAKLRPTTLSEITGQAAAVEALSRMVEGAKSRDELPGHVLLIGPPGTGKTTLAGAVAHDVGVPLQVLYGVNLRREKDLRPVLLPLAHSMAKDGETVGGGDGAGRKLLRDADGRVLGTGDSEAAGLAVGGLVLLIDEIHRMWRPLQETLYPVMEDGVLDAGRGDRWVLAPLMVIGATTDPDLLLSPLLDRFSTIVRLDPYSDDAIAAIAQKAALALGVGLDDGGAEAIAAAAGGVPRVAIKLVRAARDWATSIVTPTSGGVAVTRIGADTVNRLLSQPALVWRLKGRSAGNGTMQGAS